MINEAQKVERYFGYWPQFCDSSIWRITYERVGFIDVLDGAPAEFLAVSRIFAVRSSAVYRYY